MRCSFVGTLCVLLGIASSAVCRAGEKEMRQALDLWAQQMAEYQAALSVAGERDRATLPPPVPDDVAQALWKAVRGQTGTRDVVSPGAKKGGKRARTQKAITYEFEEEWAAPAVFWFIQYPDAFAKVFEQNPARLPKFAEAMLDALSRKHFAHPMVGQICPKIAESANTRMLEIAEKIYTRNSNPTARACAAMAMSIMLSNPALSSSEGGNARTRSKRVYYIKQALNIAPNDTMFGDISLTQAASEQIYRLRNLSIGVVPPQFNVHGIDGKPHTFPVPGKPNLLFFWSPSEEVGRSLMSKLEAMQKKYPQLEICPIVPEGDDEAWHTMLAENGITTCYMDDAQGSTGMAYRVQQLPTAVLVDAHARILYIGFPDMQLQAALDSCMEQAAKQPLPQPPPAPPAPPAANDTAPALREMPQW